MKRTQRHYTNLIYFPTKRLLTVVLSIAVLFCGVFAKLFFVTVVESKELQLKATSEWTRDIPSDAPRGQILDRNGQILASTATKYNIYVRPSDMTDKDKTAELLCAVFGYDKASTLAKISKRASEITVAKAASKEQLNMLVSSGLKGIYYAEDNYRYYPYGDFLTQVLGFTGADGDGQTGLEAYYQKYLAGVDGAVGEETDLIGRSLAGGQSYYVPAIEGMSLTSTVDVGVQRVVSAAVQKAVLTYNPKSVTCVVMDYTNGEIVSMCQYPSFDLNNVPRDDLSALFAASKSIALSTVYEPGSTFKALTAAAALDCGAVQTTTRYYCGGSMIVDGQKIKCWKSKGHGSIDFATGVQQSCNCVFMNSALAMGASRFYNYLSAFGLTTKTGVDLAGETSGIFIAEKDVKPVDLARIGFGQAVAVTPIGLIAAASAVVNDGVKVTPHLMRSIKDVYSGTTIAYPTTQGARVISSSTSATMRELLTSVVTGGSGKGAYVQGYKTAGKTGTAQKYENGAIARGKYISSFLGFSLEEQAPYAVLFLVDEPQGYVYYGSQVAAPLVGEIFKGMYDCLSVAPEFSGDELAIVGTPFELASYVGMSVTQAKIALSKLGIYVETDGEGDNVKSQYPYAGTTIDKRNAVCLYC